MAGLINPDGTPLGRELTRKRQENMMKKSTRAGDVLFKLIVDLPKELNYREVNEIMYEYFSLGAEAFKAKLG